MLKSQEPEISVIIPVYQHAKEVEKCLKTIFNQTFKNYEIIVINDGSTDNLLEVLEKYKNKIKIISQENKGAPAARNRGFKESRGKVILFCDADMELKRAILEKLFKILKKNPEKSYVYPSFKFGWKKFRCGEFNSEKLKEMNYIHTSALIRREHFPGFDESLKKFQDWDLWLTMLARGYEGIWLPEILFKIKPRKKGMSCWLPSFFYKLPLKKIGIYSKTFNDYQQAKSIIKKKHNL
ncbi:MAG: family 2 glycosyl transferase [Parcubacteria group bacterium Athens1014_10]|nr:MAG: family 2 glycosyl transferase [Parcubacteria group bacterium Athens1014_10]TSD04666.1 MAG: family 2 glycosyl transferase [Parcubacteria group bacterium Athens0714_12]